MPYQDRMLVCRDCGRTFSWSAGEQAFFAAKGFTNPPSRCKEHRLKHKAQIEGVRGAPSPKRYDIICSRCGQPGKVPFEPERKQSLLCADCFMNQRVNQVGPIARAVVNKEKINILIKAKGKKAGSTKGDSTKLTIAGRGSDVSFPG